MDQQTVATNRKAFHEYHILEKFEAGMELLGSEVKSLREGNANLKQAYILIKKGQAWVSGIHIKRYSHTGFDGHDAVRNRKLLLHQNEIAKIKAKKGEVVLLSPACASFDMFEDYIDRGNQFKSIIKTLEG